MDNILPIIMGIMGIIIAGFAVLYCLCVILIFYTNKMFIEFNVRRVDSRTGLPEGMAAGGEALMNEYHTYLTGQGFTYAGDFVAETYHSKEARLTIYESVKEGIEVTLTQMAVKNVSKKVITLTTTFEDGTVITTTTNNSPSLFKHKNRVIAYQLYDVDWKMLIGFHREKVAHEAQFSHIATKQLTETADKRTVNDNAKFLNEQIEFGYMKRSNTEPGVIVMTLRGAIVTTSKMMLFMLVREKKNTKNKTIFDTRYKRQNKIKTLMNDFRIAGCVLAMMGMLSMTRGETTPAGFVFRISAVVIGVVLVIASSIILKTLKFEDQWK